MGQVQTPAVLFSIQETAINTWTVGADYTLPAFTLSATILINFTPVTTTAPAAGTVIRIRGNQGSSGSTQYWTDLLTITTETTAAVTTTANGTVTLGSSAITTAGSATFGARSGTLYIRDDATHGEWVEQKSHVTTTLNVVNATTIAHASGANIYSQSRQYVVTVPTEGISRIRIEVDNNTQATGPTVAVEAVISSYQLATS